MRIPHFSLFVVETLCVFTDSLSLTGHQRINVLQTSVLHSSTQAAWRVLSNKHTCSSVLRLCSDTGTADLPYPPSTYSNATHQTMQHVHQRICRKSRFFSTPSKAPTDDGMTKYNISCRNLQHAVERRLSPRRASPIIMEGNEQDYATCSSKMECRDLSRLSFMCSTFSVSYRRFRYVSDTASFRHCLSNCRPLVYFYDWKKSCDSSLYRRHPGRAEDI
jgi:hypothetical protein